MRIYPSVGVAVVAFTLGIVPASAQDATTIEVTPYVALDTAGGSPVGVVVAFLVTSTLSVETDVAYRRAEGGIHALSTNTPLVVPAARRRIDTVCGRGNRAVEARGGRAVARRPPDR